MTTHAATAEAAVGAAVRISGRHDRLRIAKYTPIAPITSGTVSLQTAARTMNGSAHSQRPSSMYRKAQRRSGVARATGWNLSLIHISEPTRLGMISYAV